MTLVYITCRDNKEAEKVAMHLLKKRLVACANIFPVKSMYWWKGRIEKSNETVVIAKTKEGYFNRIVKEVGKIHSYETPCVLKIGTESGKGFKKWVDEEIR